MPTIKIAKASLHVELDGPEGAPWLVLSNSLGATLEMWRPQLVALTADFRILRYDTRGHGQSAVPPGPYSIADLGGDVLRLLDALRIERAHFCGLSMGGTTGIWLGAHAAERIDRLVLCNTMAYFGPPDALDARIAIIRRDGMAAVTDGILARWFTPEFAAVDPPAVAAIRATLLAAPVEGYVACCAALRELDERESLARIGAPTLLIGGTHDPAPTPHALRDLAARIRGARYVELPTAHLSNVAAAPAFNDAVRGHLLGEATTR